MINFFYVIFRAKIDRKKEGLLEVCPEILCENVKEAEHLAATLALYHLCKGQVGLWRMDKLGTFSVIFFPRETSFVTSCFSGFSKDCTSFERGLL